MLQTINFMFLHLSHVYTFNLRKFVRATLYIRLQLIIL